MQTFSVVSNRPSVSDTERAQALAAEQAVQEMPLYPRTGGVKLVDGAVVVKLNETPTPVGE